jgi:anti-anti-sigma regulatory factor
MAACTLLRPTWGRTGEGGSDDPDQGDCVDVSTITTPAGKVIAIRLDESLDVRVHRLFVKACELAAADGSRASIEVNCAETRTVRDSGLAMLMMLRETTGRRGVSMQLVNCSPQLKSQLLAARLGGDISRQTNPGVVHCHFA